MQNRSQNRTLVIKPHPLAYELGVSTSTLSRWWKYRLHGFPAPIFIGRKVLGWRIASIENWLANKEASVEE